MMAASVMMLEISVSISSLASTPACFTVSFSRSFMEETLWTDSSLSMLTFSNRASAAPAARPPQKACSFVPPRSITSFAWLEAADAPMKKVAAVGTPRAVAAPTCTALSATLMPVW